MKKYEGLEAFKISLNNGSFIATSNDQCVAMIQLKMENGICVSDPDLQQVEYVGDKG